MTGNESDMTQGQSQFAFPLARSIFDLFVVTAGMGLVAGAVAPSDQIGASLAGVLCCLPGSIAGLLPVAMRATAYEDGVGTGFILGVTVRMVLTLGAFIALRVATGWDPKTLGGWAVATYLVLLVYEVGSIRRYLSRRDRLAGGLA